MESIALMGGLITIAMAIQATNSAHCLFMHKCLCLHYSGE